MLTGILDDFNRADENPLSGGGNWTTAGDAPEIVSNQVTSSSTGDAFWVAGSEIADGEAYFTVAALVDTGSSTILYARWNVSSPAGYIFVYGEGNFSLYRWDPGYVEIDTSIGDNFDAGDQMRLLFVGSQIEGWVNHDGVWEMVVSGTDSTFTSGRIGFGVVTTNAIDDFGGGEVRTRGAVQIGAVSAVGL